LCDSRCLFGLLHCHKFAREHLDAVLEFADSLEQVVDPDVLAEVPCDAAEAALENPEAARARTRTELEPAAEPLASPARAEGPEAAEGGSAGWRPSSPVRRG